ncbi:hypothetical protein ABZU86_25905 [Streptomyces sp. NPDC005271]|uniref:hypothetical protein n=1 Tax=unclassified Streptomyces TaxID=2593676 RepID=UPI0033A920C8
MSSSGRREATDSTADEPVASGISRVCGGSSSAGPEFSGRRACRTTMGAGVLGAVSGDAASTPRRSSLTSTAPSRATASQSVIRCIAPASASESRTGSRFSRAVS